MLLGVREVIAERERERERGGGGGREEGQRNEVSV